MAGHLADQRAELDAAFRALADPTRVEVLARGPGGRFMTAVIDMVPEGAGTRCTAWVLNNTPEDREKHEAMGFFDGWGSAIGQRDEVATGLRDG